MRFRVVDIETSGSKPSEIIEIAAVDVVRRGAGWAAEPPRAQLFRPQGDISVHAMAIHHLTPSDFPESVPVCLPERLQAFLQAAESADCFVAHNASFERRHIPDCLVSGAIWLCTVKTARAAWPDAPGYSNQVLRYWRGLDLDPGLAMPPHRAAPDAWVTAHILIDLLQDRSPADLLRLQAASLERVPFGRYRGQAWSAVPIDYLTWMAGQPDMDPGVIERAKTEHRAREPAATAAVERSAATLGRS